MKKLLLLPFMALFFVQAYGQDSSWAFSFYITPHSSFRSLKSINGTADTMVSRLNGIDKAAFKFDVGVRIAYNFGRRIRATLGLTYASKGYNTAVNVDTGNKVIKTVAATEYTRYTLLEIPFYLTYKVIDSNFKFGIVGGIVNGILLGVEQVVPGYSQGAPTNTINSFSNSGLNSANYASYHFGIILGLEFGYQVSNQVNFFIQPNYRFTFTNFLPSTGQPNPSIGDFINGHLYNIGASVGFDYKF